MAVIKLSVLADAFEECFDEWNQYLNIKTGEIVSIPEDPWLIDEMEDKELIGEIGISEGYYDFRHNAFIEKSREWCEYKGIDFEE